MSNRFHNKFHRFNHQTFKNPDIPDAGYDPIASHDVPFQGDFVMVEDGISKISGALIDTDFINRFSSAGMIHVGTSGGIDTFNVWPEYHAVIETGGSIIEASGMHYVHVDTGAAISNSSYAVASLGASVVDANNTFSIGAVLNSVPNTFMLATSSEDRISNYGMQEQTGYIYAKNGLRIDSGRIELSSTSGTSVAGGTLSAASISATSISAIGISAIDGIVLKDTLANTFYRITIVSGAISVTQVL